LEWAKAVWDGFVDDDDLRAAWREALPSVGSSARPFSEVHGPGGAMIASALRIGWKIPSPFVFIDARGQHLELRSMCPAVVLQHAERDLSHVEACSSTLAGRIDGPPDLEPLTDYISSRKMRRTAVAGSLRALGEGGWWTQARLFEAELEGVDDPYCRACSAHEAELRWAGTLHHRCCGCPATMALREGHKDQEIIGMAQSLLHGCKPLFQHGVPVRLPPPRTPTLVRRWCGAGPSPQEDFTFTGVGFTDGALRGGAPQPARRAGWAAVLVDSDGQVIHGIYGPCPDAFPTSLRAELWAVLEMLRMALPPLRIWVDNKGVVDGWHRGRTWCCSSSRPAADLWKQVWDKLDDIGVDGIEVRKCKGHATEADVHAGRSTEFLRRGNDHADHFAGRGVDIAEHMSPSAAHKAAYREAHRWYRWLAVIAEHWPHDVQPVPAQKRSKPAKDRAAVSMAEWERHADSPHSVTDEDGRLRCVLCHRSVSLSAPLHLQRAFVKSKCRGALTDVARAGASVPLAQRLGVGHVLFASGELIWCKRCGCYGQKRLRELRNVCKGESTGGRVTTLQRLLRGEHPQSAERLVPAVRLSAGHGEQ
jgi:hypothetical protein